MIAESLAHYQIIKKLGAGGMGEVYLALDTKLKRNVAIKVLSPETLRKENAAKRLIREAQAVAKLDHPNICTIYDVVETAEHTFIVMQYLEGETLHQKLKRKVLRLNEALDIAKQVTAGLQEAHAHGIVHRDLKPQNIMITARGVTKILDFGLCKLEVDGGDSEAPTVSLLSTPGRIMGTVPYMSPEQLKGEPIEKSSDIFSLGVTFYEMFGGKHPFKEQNDAVTMSNILVAEPFKSDRLQKLATPELESLLARMLQKNAGERPQTADEVLAGLNQVPALELDETISLAAATRELPKTVTDMVVPQEGSAFSRNKRIALFALSALVAIIFGAIALSRWLAGDRLDSIAILPFTYSSSDPKLMANPDREYLSDGITDSVINSLSQVPELKVIARSSVFRYKNKDLDVRAIGTELGVRTVLSGDIKQEGDKLIIRAELQDIGENRSLGVYSFETSSSAIQGAEKDLAQDTLQKLRLRLSGAQQTGLTKTYTQSGEAYEAYLKGRYHWNKRTDEGFKQAASFFQEAIDKDPNYALAYTGLADCYTLRSDYGFLAPMEGYTLAKGAVNLALKYDPTLAEAHTSLASIMAVIDWNWQGAESEYRKAIELNPNYATAHHWYATQLMLQGRSDEALLEIRKAKQLDPLSLGINKDYAIILLYAKKYDEALAQCKETLRIEPSFAVMSTYSAQIYELQGKREAALVELEKAHAASPDNGEVTYGLAQAYALNERKDEARKLATDLSNPANGGIYLPKEAAYLSFLLGDIDETFSTLQKASNGHYISVAELKADPRLDKLREDSRTTALVESIGLTK
ncbi:MAG TPA: protein kinase [Pyrinomonadaceae bacterium]|nr:protein kinase [Pyrinomonadaceae bacterium]